MKRLVSTAVFLLASAAFGLSQTVIYSNFGSQKGKIYDCCNGYQFRYNSSIGAIAVPFVAPDNVTKLDHVAVAVQWVKAGGNRWHGAPFDNLHDANWSIAGDNNGLPGGNITGGTFFKIPNVNTCCRRMTGGKKKNLQLDPGVQYWLVVSWAGTIGTVDQWAYNTTGATDPFAIEDQNGWYLVTDMTTPAVKIVGK